MFTKHKWVAVIRGNHWVLAKTAPSGIELDVLRIAELTLEGNPAAQASMLKSWLRKQRVPLKKLQLTVSFPGVITRIIALPILSMKDLDKLLTEQVDQYFTLNIEDYVVDYRVLDYFEDNGQKLQRVLLAALPKYQWESLWSLWKTVGLKPKVVDLAASGLSQLYAKLEKSERSGKSEENQVSVSEKLPMKPIKKQKEKFNLNTEIDFGILVRDIRSMLSLKTKKQSKKAELSQTIRQNAPDIAIVDLNAGRFEIILLERGVFFLYSDILSDFQPQELALNQEAQKDSESVLSHDLWLAYEEMESALAPAIRQISEFFDFFSARHYGKTMDRLYLTGEFSNLPRLRDVFESNLEVETQIGFPESWSPCFKRKAKKSQRDWMKYGSLYGLALRED